MGLFDRFKRKNDNEELERLKKENKELKRTVNILLQRIASDNEWGENNEQSFEKQFESTKVLKKPQVPKKRHISELKQFDTYKIPRYYDKSKNKFYTIHYGRKEYLNLTWEQLREIVRNCNKLSAFHSPTEAITNNPLFEGMSKGQYTNYRYYWRAGAFNEAIKKYASELGYNEHKLISTEVI